MKVIDEKGKLFGKLNIIDLLVIILVIAAILFVCVKVLGSGGEEGAPAAKLTYTVRVSAQRPALADRVGEYVSTAAGKKDQLMAGGEMLDAYIVDYWTEPSRYRWVTTNTVEVYNSEDENAADLVDICFVIEANVTNTTTNEVGTQEVRVGKSHIVKTTHLEFASGVIESCASTAEP